MSLPSLGLEPALGRRGICMYAHVYVPMSVSVCMHVCVYVSMHYEWREGAERRIAARL